MKRRIWPVLAMLAMLTAPVLQAPPAHGATPGGVFVTGHDPDFHALRGPNAPGARTIIQKAIGYVTNDKAEPKVLLVTSRIAPPPGHVDSASGMTAAGYTFDMASAAANGGTLPLGDVDLTLYDVVVVASDFGGILMQDELNILNRRSADVLDYVNGGGGLVAFAESNSGSHLTPTGGRFDFLPFLVAETSLDQTETGYTVTDFGRTVIGLENSDVNGNFSHNVFTATGGMDVVDRDAFGRIMSLATRGRQICPTGVLSASIDDVSRAEGSGGGSTAFTFTVSLSAPVCGDAAAVQFVTADGSAVAGSDYTGTSGTLTFPEGGSSQTITVSVAADSTFEPDETFFVNLSDPVRMSISDGQGVGTIGNDDPENRDPDCSSVAPSSTSLWPPNHELRTVPVSGGTDPDGDTVTLSVVGVTQDEALNGTGDGDTAPDAAAGTASNEVQLRAERAGSGDGRVYRISVSGSDGRGGTCSTVVSVAVPHNQAPGSQAVDSGLLVNSFG
jgi:hypothetical protein